MRVSTAGGLREGRYGALGAADGPLSQTAACLGLARLPVVTTRQYAVPLLKEQRDTDIWLSARYPGGYAWLFPKGGVANLGLGLDPALDDDMKAPLDELHASLAREGRVGAEVLLRTGGPIPVGGLRERIVVGRALLAGDAAGRTGDEEATVFDSTGLAIQDLAIALAAIDQIDEIPGLARIEL